MYKLHIQYARLSNLYFLLWLMGRLEENNFMNSTWEISKSKILSHKMGFDIKNILDEEGLDFVIKKIRELNPSVELKKGNNCNIIFSSTSAEDLLLPKWFYYSEINWITNKYTTNSKKYMSIRVYPIEYYDSKFI